MEKREQSILEFIRREGGAQSSGVHEHLIRDGYDISLVSVKRMLARLDKAGILETLGTGRATAYKLTAYGKMVTPVDAEKYNEIEPDKRFGAKGYDFDLFGQIRTVFDDAEMVLLNEATELFKSRGIGASEIVRKKELERFIIELSWKSSKIEGNTYTLLDTEALILRGSRPDGHSDEEARMILNHKSAFDYVYGHRDMFKELTRKNLEDVHRHIVEGLNVKNNFRSKPVGIAGSVYRPLDNEFQIAEAVDALAKAVSNLTNPYEKAFFSIIGTSYIQPFEDGNKRTSRIMGNAILLAHGLAPLSYRNVDEKTYREAILVFYELNSIMPFKKIFIEQYIFSANNYLLGAD